MNIEKIKTLGDLKKSGYQSKKVKDELRDNLIGELKKNSGLFDEIKGYEETVIPQLETAILSRHNILLLGLRGQAKTRLARMMVRLLDEYIPVVTGSELNDDPFHPISRYAADLIAEMKDETPISFMHRDERYTEKLATPDVTVADLIGDLDAIKAATLKLAYADERVIHYGLIPRSHRSIFVINELPDLQARIQVALFNILQEGDIQIRGFKLRLPLDIQFVFTANPEDYTNRGSIVTPLKDRIGSQILTHYPHSVEIAQSITQQEAKIPVDQNKNIIVPQLIKDLIEQIAFEARKSEYIDQKSGVSARLTISAYENIYSVVQRRMLLNSEEKSVARINDMYGLVAALTGKVELVYEGELEGISNVAITLISKSIRSLFINYFPDPEKMKKAKLKNPYAEIIAWFNDGNTADLIHTGSDHDYEKLLKSIPSLQDVVKNYTKPADKTELLLMSEFILHGLAEFSQISKKKLVSNTSFSDLVGSIFNMKNQEED
ncbi:MAG: magnesium chelatase [Bacteroidota bacterium]